MGGYFPNKFYADDGHERHVFEVIRRLLTRRLGAFVDVGTNVGQTLCKVLAIDRNRRYVGLEPQIACCFYVDQFIKLNGLANAQVIPVGLGESTGFLPLHVMGDIDDMASLDETGLRATTSAAHATLAVPIFHGDEVMRQLHLDAIAIIKIDVEGSELMILRGLESTIQRTRPALIFEVLPNFVGIERTMIDRSLAERNKRRAKEVFKFLNRLSYGIHQIDARGDIRSIQSFELDDREAYVGSDYLALPLEFGSESLTPN